MLHTKFHGNRLLVPRRRFLKGFYRIWAWRPSWSCDPDAPNKLSFPLHKDGSTYNLALIGPAVSEKKMSEHCERRTDGRPWVSYKLTYEPSAQVS